MYFHFVASEPWLALVAHFYTKGSATHLHSTYTIVHSFHLRGQHKPKAVPDAKHTHCSLAIYQIG